jgi:RimJ/RimL family protein N-acetyltransferase
MWDRIRIRPMTRDDAAALQAVFDGLSAESRRRRFHAPVGVLAPTLARPLLDIDHHRHVALLAEAGGRRDPQAVGIARYVRETEDRAEIAVEVADAWQGRGVGSRLVRALVDHARRAGVRELHGEVLAENEPVQRLLAHQLPAARFTDQGRVRHVWSDLRPAPLRVEDVMADLGVVAAAPTP